MWRWRARQSASILARGRVPILAGGTPLYLQRGGGGVAGAARRHDPALRAELEAEAEQDGLAALGTGSGRSGGGGAVGGEFAAGGARIGGVPDNGRADVGAGGGRSRHPGCIRSS
ncbi:MAG: hypothetical protein U0232_25220 [Thermomicrobiales bacterium]